MPISEYEQSGEKMAPTDKYGKGRMGLGLVVTNQLTGFHE